MTDNIITAYLSLGSNLGDRQANIDRALEMLAERMQMGKISSVYDTEPLGNTKQPRFLNIACEVITRLSPEGLLALAKGIETRLGRYGKSGEPRPIDIDILLYGDKVVNTPNLVIPHPRMAERAFVLVPMVEIAPTLKHPTLGQTMKQLLKAAKEKQGVLKLE